MGRVFETVLIQDSSHSHLESDGRTKGFLISTKGVIGIRASPNKSSGPI